MIWYFILLETTRKNLKQIEIKILPVKSGCKNVFLRGKQNTLLSLKNLYLKHFFRALSQVKYFSALNNF